MAHTFIRSLVFVFLLFVFACTPKQETSSPDLSTPVESMAEENTPVEEAEEPIQEELKPVNISDLPYTGFPYGFLGGRQLVFDKDKVEMIPVYDAPSGKKVSQLKLFFRGQVEAGFVLQPEGVDFSDYEATKNQQYYKTGYDFELIYVNYYAVKEGFIKILAKDHESYWVDYRDIEEHFRPIRFIEDIAERNGWQVFGYENYRLRKAPGLHGEIIVKLSERKHVIKKFSRIEGNWAEALIYEIKAPLDECYSDEDLTAAMTGKTYTGWIRVVDENGQVSDINFYSSC